MRRLLHLFDFGCMTDDNRTRLHLMCRHRRDMCRLNRMARCRRQVRMTHRRSMRHLDRLRLRCRLRNIHRLVRTRRARCISHLPFFTWNSHGRHLLPSVHAACHEWEDCGEDVRVYPDIVDRRREKRKLESNANIDRDRDTSFDKVEGSESDWRWGGCVGVWSRREGDVTTITHTTVLGCVSRESGIQARKIHRNEDFGIELVCKLEADRDGRLERESELDINVRNIYLERKGCECRALEASDATFGDVCKLKADG